LTLSIPDDYCGEQLEIPDSVHELRFEVSWNWTKSLMVYFGRESRLRYFSLNVLDASRFFPPEWMRTVSRVRFFCRFSEGRLKSCRYLLEFTPWI
jgi:hypothetical protein